MATVVTNAGEAIVTNRIIGSGTEPLNIGWGTGAASATQTGTSLSTEVLVSGSGGGTDHTVGTSSRVTTTNTNDTYQVTGTRTATSAITSITNAGLFDAASGGNLFLWGNFSALGLSNGDSIAFTFKAIQTN